MSRSDEPIDEPLDPALDRLLDAERARPEIPGTGPAAERLLGRVLVTVGQPPPGGGAPPDGGSSAGGSAAGTGGAAGSGGAALAHPALVGALGLVVGMVAGAVMHATLAPAEIQIVVRDARADGGIAEIATAHGASAPTAHRGTTTPTDDGIDRGATAPTDDGVDRGATTPTDDVIDPGATAPTDVIDRGATAPTHTAPSDAIDRGATAPSDAVDPGAAAPTAGGGARTRSATARGDDGDGARGPDAGVATPLAREAALIARAQSALARGGPALAIAALREHEQRHPDGQLREEREALWISALVAAGDREAAVARASRFRARFPGSSLQPVVDAALRSP